MLTTNSQTVLVDAPTTLKDRRSFPGVLEWTDLALCRGRTDLFFPHLRERPERRARREAEARAICMACSVREPC